MLQAFVESEQTSLRFSSSLTGNERKCVHQVNLITNQSTSLIIYHNKQISEEIGLFHISKGQGRERYIEVTKMSTDSETTNSREVESDGVQNEPVGMMWL